MLHKCLHTASWVAPTIRPRALDYKETSDDYDVDTIFLAAPSTSMERLKRIIDYTSGFLYLVSVFGVTGARERLQHMTLQQIKRILPYTSGRVPSLLVLEYRNRNTPKP